MANLQNTVTGLLFKVFGLSICKQHFGVFTVKFLLNQITTNKIASLENIFTRRRIKVLRYSYSAYD